MIDDASQPSLDSDSGWKIRYAGARIPRVVDVPVSAASTASCPLLPPPVQVIHNASIDQRALVSSLKPSFLVLKFENQDQPQSTPFADLSDLF